jgi:hypothetical protein
MGAAMRSRLRTSFALTLLLLVTAGCVWIDYSLKMSLQPAALISGTLLYALLLGLTAFNARKKLPFLPLLKAKTWLNFHIYAGWFSVALFLVHLDFHLPSGGLESLIAALFVLVALSGVVGHVLSRVLPARLTVHGENILFERIPGYRVDLRREVEEIVLAAVESIGSTTVSDFHERHLADYFARPRHLLSHLFGSPKPLHKLLERIDALDRFLNSEEREVMKRIANRVQVKDNLDFQWYVQGLLKVWLFVHIPLTYGLLILAAAHGMLAWKFT